MRAPRFAFVVAWLSLGGAARGGEALLPGPPVGRTGDSAARRFTLAGGRKITCLNGQLTLDNDGRLRACALARRLTVSSVTFPPGTTLRWDEAGVVRGGSLPAPLRVAGFRLRWDFQLYGDGKLQTGELAEPTRVQGHDFPVGAKLAFRSDGTLEHAEYVEGSGFMIHGEAWRNTARVDYDRSGAETNRSVDRWQSEVRHDPVPRKFR